MSYSPIDPGTQNWDVPLNAALTDQDLRITDNLTLIQATNSAADKVENSTYTAADYGFQSWSYDPILGTSTSGVLTSGTLYLHKIKVTNSFVCSNIIYVIHAAAVTPVSGQNFMALYDLAGNRVAVSADLGTDWTSTGTKTTPWTSSVSLTPGFYYAAILPNAATNINTIKTAGFTNAGAFNAVQANQDIRSSTGGTGLTSLTAMPSTITMSNRNAGGTNTFWFALT
jgi:hypothetical protein